MTSTYLIYFLLNWLVNILAIEFFAIRKIKNVIKTDEARDSKFPAFRRHDVFWFSRPWLYLTCHVCIIKVAYTIWTLFCCGCISIFIRGTMKNPDEPLTGWRYLLMRVNCYWTSVVVLFGSSSIFWIFEKKPEVCYKKYLGPDWTPDYDIKNCSTLLMNHQAFIDIAMTSMK